MKPEAARSGLDNPSVMTDEWIYRLEGSSMDAQARVIDLDEYRRRRAEQRERTQPAMPAPVMWVPVWVWVPVWPMM